MPAGEGVVILDPGCGLRMGETGELVDVYKRIGDSFKRKSRCGLMRMPQYVIC